MSQLLKIRVGIELVPYILLWCLTLKSLGSVSSNTHFLAVFVSGSYEIAEFPFLLSGVSHSWDFRDISYKLHSYYGKSHGKRQK